MIYKLSILLILVACSCSLRDPQKIVDKAIDAAGGNRYLNSTIEFDFRNRHYIAKRKDGIFSYERVFKDPADSTQLVHDYLNNDGFRREVNQVEMAVADSMSVKYSASVNSVLYFALLPYGLNDRSVQKEFMGETTLDGQEYYKIKITFQQNGGGEDYQDVFYYWINKNNFRIDFLSYSFIENDEIGYRFRKAYNVRDVNGILFQDYINYTPPGNENLDQLEELYKKNELKELSKIELENIVVQ